MWLFKKLHFITSSLNSNIVNTRVVRRGDDRGDERHRFVYSLLKTRKLVHVLWK